MKKAALVIILLTVISKILGFLREIVLSYYYGASTISDVYFVSLIIPGSIFALIGVGITTNFIPLFTNVENKKGSISANLFVNNVLGFVSILSIIVIILVFIFTETIVKLFAIGFEGETLKTAILFTKISIIGIFFYGISYIFTGFLNIKNNFTIPILTTLPFNLTIVVSIILAYHFDMILLAYGSLLAIALQAFFMLPSVLKNNFSFKIALNFKDKYLRKIIFLSIPVILGTSINQVNRLVDRTLASDIVVGGISALNYSDRVNHFILGIFVTSIVTVIFPSFAKMSVDNNLVSIKSLFTQAVNSMSLIIIPATIGSMIFSKEIISLLFGRGSFDDNAVSLTSSAFFFYSLGLIGIGLREITSRIFYALHDTKTPMINASIGLVLNIILNIILSQYLGIGGLALATSIASLVTALLMILSLKRKIGSFGIRKMLVLFLKVLSAGLVMGIVAKFSFIYIKNILSQDLSLIIAVNLSLISYFVLVSYMNIQEVNIILSAIKKKFLKVFK